MKNCNLYMLQCAYKKAQIALLNNNVPIGCVLSDKKNVFIVEGNTNSKNRKFLEHAELKCLIKFQKSGIRCDDLYIYSTLIPCPMCCGAIYINNIDRCYYGTLSHNKFYNDNFFSIMKNKKYHSYLSVKCSKLLNAFFLIRR